MDRPTRRVNNAIGDESITGRRDVWSTYSGVLGRHEGVSQVTKPLRVGISIVIDVRDELARGCFSSSIPRIAQTTVLSVDQPKSKLICDRRCSILRAIVDYNYLVVW